MTIVFILFVNFSEKGSKIHSGPLIEPKRLGHRSNILPLIYSVDILYFPFPNWLTDCSTAGIQQYTTQVIFNLVRYIYKPIDFELILKN